MKKIAIITSYFDTPLNLQALLNPEDFVLCTDGGYDIAVAQQIQPHLLVGDLDSITASVPQSLPTITFPPEKDYTDLELALEHAATLDPDEVEIFGGIGGRLDHTVANLQIMSHYSNVFPRLTMTDGRNTCFILNGPVRETQRIPAKENCYISLFSLSETCTGVTIQDVKYPLKNHTLTRSFPLGVSNEFVKKEAALSVKSGTLLVVISQK